LDQPFRGSEAVRLGLVTSNQLAGPRFRRLLPDVYAPSGVVDDLALRSSAAYLLVRAQGGLLAGYSAALLLGADRAVPGAPAEVLVPRKYRRHRGLVVRYGTASGTDVLEVAGCRVTSAPRTAWDLARRLPLIEAVVAVDALARRGGFEPAELLVRRSLEPGARGCRRLDEVVALADPRAESPMETRLRIRLVFGGLPAPEVQFRVRDEYGFVLARVDLGYPEAKLAIEYDGASHYTRRRAELDRARDAELLGHGWRTLRLGRDQVDAADTVRRIRDLLASPTTRPTARSGSPS